MISKETRERLCEKHKSLLELVYYFGKGIMFRQHILRYMEFDGIHEIDVSKSILALKKNEIIDFQDMFGARIIVLKKFAICFLLKKKQESVASIQFTMGKAKQSAFLNQHILSNIGLFKRKKMLLLEKKEDYLLKDLITHFLTKTTYFNKDKESYLFLENQIKDKDVFTELTAEEEVQSLKLIKDNAWLFKKSSKKTYSFNLNSMQSSHIYFGMRTRLHGQSIDILDMNGLMDHKKFVSKINKTKEYLNALFTKGNNKFRFILYVQSEERKGSILKNEKQINELLHKYWNENDRIQWEVVNLNLEKTLFKNQKILLNV